MTVKADWHVDLDVGPTSDPFPPGHVQLCVTEVGTRVAVENEERLTTRFDELMEREQQLYTRGVVCPLKEDKQVVCSACPLRHVDPLDTATALCDVGVEQESVVTRLRILSHERGTEAA